MILAKQQGLNTLFALLIINLKRLTVLQITARDKLFTYGPIPLPIRTSRTPSDISRAPCPSAGPWERGRTC